MTSSPSFELVTRLVPRAGIDAQVTPATLHRARDRSRPIAVGVRVGHRVVSRIRINCRQVPRLSVLGDLAWILQLGFRREVPTHGIPKCRKNFVAAAATAPSSLCSSTASSMASASPSSARVGMPSTAFALARKTRHLATEVLRAAASAVSPPSCSRDASTISLVRKAPMKFSASANACATSVMMASFLNGRTESCRPRRSSQPWQRLSRLVRTHPRPGAWSRCMRTTL